MIDRSDHLNELATALAKAQAQIATAKKDSQNPFFRSTYADLASVWEACREPLTANGLSVAQFPGFVAGNPPVATLTTVLLHTSGQWMAETAGAPLPDQKRKDGSEEKANAQGVGSAITYLRRYALAAVASVSPADDDGNAAAGRGSKSPAPSKGSAARVTSAPVAVTPPPTESLDEKPRVLAAKQPDPLKGEDADPPTWPFGTNRGKLLSSFSSDGLLASRGWLVKKARNPEEFATLVQQIDDELASRQGE